MEHANTDDGDDVYDYNSDDYDDGGGGGAAAAAPQARELDPGNPSDFALMHPMDGVKAMFPFEGERVNSRGETVQTQMVRQLFNILTTGNTMHDGIKPLEQKILPVYRMPFVSDPESEFIAKGDEIRKIKIGNPMSTYIPEPGEIKIRDEIVEAVNSPEMLDRPLVFLVNTNIPHCGIYILVGGILYSFGYGGDGPAGQGSDVVSHGAIYSTDLLMKDDQAARIVWVGILDKELLARMNAKFATVSEIKFTVRKVMGENIISRNSVLLIPDKYSRVSAEGNDLYYDCFKWALEVFDILRGIQDNYRAFFMTQIDSEIIHQLLKCYLYSGKDIPPDILQEEFLQILKIANSKFYTEAQWFNLEWRLRSTAHGGRRIKKFRSCNKGNRKCKKQTRNNKPRNNKTKKTRNNKTRMSRKMKK